MNTILIAVTVLFFVTQSAAPVSYTHLDVYKRQVQTIPYSYSVIPL